MSTAKTTAKAQATDDAAVGLNPAEKKLLYSAITHLQGSIDFEKVSVDIEVHNAEAARKRLKRLLEKEHITTTIKGDRIGGGENAEDSWGTTKASAKKPAKKKIPATTNEPEASKAAGKKRKVTEMEEDQAENPEVKAEDPATVSITEDA